MLIVELHWLKVQERFEFKILLLLNCFDRLAPSYLTNFVKYNSSGFRDVSLHCHINSPPRAFSSSAPRLWNNIPQEKCKHQGKIFIRRLAVLIATKTNEEYSQVMCNIRTRLSMDIMRSVLVAVRGVRGKAKKAWTAPISNVSFNLIPEERSYEG